MHLHSNETILLQNEIFCLDKNPDFFEKKKLRKR